MRIIITLVSLLAGVGGGFALAPSTWAAIVAMQAADAAAETEAEPAPAPTLIDVTTLANAPAGWGEEERQRVAWELDAMYLRNGNEVLVGTAPPDRKVLVVKGMFNRSSTMKLASEYDFEALQRAGFRLLITQSGNEVRGYDVNEVVAWGRVMGPFDTDTFVELRDAMRN